MVTIRSSNDIVLSLVDFFKVSLPDLDTKPGTVARDLFIDAPASQISLLYDELSKISNFQSLRLVAGSDLDKLAQNFGASRKSATPASGVALFTFSSLPAVVSINKGDVVTASNGATFVVVNGVSVDPASSNSFKSIALKYQNDLSFLGITDPYAVEVSVQASTPGATGNISKYALTTTVIPGVSNVTNVFPFTGGNDQEDDATFRNRVLSIFSGSNIGTALGYRNLALSDSSVEDALVIGPGNPLMTRDGSIVKQNADGTFTVISEGTGGKIDIVILGTIISEFTDTFIYLDQSNNNDPTDPKNIVVLGQIAADAGKTITQKRIDDIANGTVPAQPVQDVLDVTGSLSGGNFVQKIVDSLGRVSGNYEIIKDTGFYGGSPFGFDSFHWVSNKISLFQEDRIKSKFNGQDNTTFVDVLEIPDVQQNISITNENSIVSTSDRSIIQLIHTPATNVTRVFNVNTGERYTVTNQNLDGTGATNNTGRIQISGNTLPASSDILQVDYTWIVDYDAFSDYDGKILSNNIRPITDSVDWGMSSAIRSERVLFTQNATNTFFNGSTKLPISSVVSANIFSITDGTVQPSTVPNFSTRLTITLAPLSEPINTIENIKLEHTPEEIYNTAEDDGFVISNRIVVGPQIKYSVIIVLPTDTPAIVGQPVTITYNQTDTFNITNSTGSFIANQLTIPVGNVPVSTSQIYLDVTYFAATQDVLTAGITNLPISRSGNGFLLNSNVGSLNTIKSDTIKRETQTIQQNGSNQLFVTLNLSANDYSLIATQIITVIDQLGAKEIWNADFPGTLTTDSNNNYQLIFSGFNAPAVGDNVLIIYFADDIRRAQPFTYNNSIIRKDFESLLFNFTTNNFYVPIVDLVAESNLTFDIIDNTTGLSVGSGTDGYIASVQSNGATGSFSSTSLSFFTDTAFTTVAAGSDGATLPTATINVNSTIGFAASGTIFVTTVTGAQIVTYTGTSPTSFTGCTGGTGVIHTGYSVSNGIDDIIGKTLLIHHPVNINNGGRFDILAYNSSTNTLTIGITSNSLNTNQVSIIRIPDNKDLWNSTTGTIDSTNNILNLPTNALAFQGDKVVILLFTNQNLHQAPTKLSVTVADQVQNTGVITALGTTVTKVADVVFSAINNGLQQNVLEAIKTFLGVNSNAIISSNNYLVRLVKLEKVSTTTDNEVLTTLATYDVFGSGLNNNLLYMNEMIMNSSLQNTEFLLPSSTNNLNNAPKIGDKLRVTFYYATDNDTENVYFTRNGTLYTNKKFAFIEQLYVSSGFNASLSSRLTFSYFTQPAVGSRYKVFYDYLAPKQNERILINYNYNKVISDVTFLVETQRPINADVLVRAAKELLVDATMNIVIKSDFISSATIVIQNTVSKLIAAINTNTLGAVLNSSDLIAAAQSVDGVDRARIIYFNQDGQVGQVLTLVAQSDQYFVANNIVVDQESR